ncbi:TorD/DmsD family molecular chaperone [Halomarina litorea]|uniref:TorD/DmsD family molecular chaperone n=1 Tax=Halomarina litorea TaxID=2961595 RepID=UPI0020C5013D|nr:molecular chaperone TorD family protein [Halomarina sp. BCD28]
MDDQVYAGRIDLLEFLSALLDGPPDERFVQGLFAGEVAGPAPSVNESLDRGFDLLATFHDDEAGSDPSAVAERVGAEYASLFESGAVSTRESAYREPDADADRELAAAYAAADWSAPDGHRDALGTELAFLRHLVARQRAGHAAALEQERAFVDEHLSRWVDPFARDLAEAADSTLYRGVAHLLRGVVEFEDALVTTQLLE